MGSKSGNNALGSAPRFVGLFLFVAGVVLYASMFISGTWKARALYDSYVEMVRVIHGEVEHNPWCSVDGCDGEIRHNNRGCWCAWECGQSVVVGRQKSYYDEEVRQGRRYSILNILESLKMYSFQRVSDFRVQFLLSVLSFIVIVMSSGLCLAGCVKGLLVDENNYLSLMRVQVVLWGSILMGGYSVAVSVNVGFCSDALIMTKNAVPFPMMNGYLWALLGVVTLSPVVSYPISRVGGASKGKARKTCADATFSDLLLGDGANLGRMPQLARVQCLFITLLLLLFYFMSVWNNLHNVSLEMISNAVANNNIMYSNMPDVDGTFVALLTSSHAIFQGGKLLTKKFG